MVHILPGAKPQQRSTVCFLLFIFTVAQSRYLSDHWVPLPDWVRSPVQTEGIPQLSSVVQTGSASSYASGQAPIFVVNCLDNNKWCCSDDLCALLPQIWFVWWGQATERKRRGWIIPHDFAEFVLVNGKRVKYLSAGGIGVVTVRNSWNIYTVSCLFVVLGFSAGCGNAAEACQHFAE